MPSVSGVPWWGALACAAAPITIGYLVDSMAGTELTLFFSMMYLIGCLVAVLVVQNKSLFTAMVQPPLLMVIAVPLAYKTFAAGPMQGLKSLVLDMALPLIDRFPMMIFTTVMVWIIGAFRLTLYIQEKRGNQSPAGKRRAPLRNARTAPTRPTARTAAATPAARKAASPAEARRAPAGMAVAGQSRTGQLRQPSEQPSAPPRTRTSRRSPIEPQPVAEQPRRARRTAPVSQAEQLEPTHERTPRPRRDGIPRTRTAQGPRHTDAPRRAPPPPTPQPPTPQPAAPQPATTRPPATDGPSAGRRRLPQESVREFAERQGEVPRYMASSPESARPRTPGGAEPSVPRLPNVRYRD